MSTEDWKRALSHGATTITWSSLSAKPMNLWWTTRGTGGVLSWLSSSERKWRGWTQTSTLGSKSIQKTVIISVWVMAKTVFCEVTVTSVTIKFLSAHPWIQVNVCAKFGEIPSRRSWDIAFTRIGWTNRQPENIMPQQPSLAWRHKKEPPSGLFIYSRW